VKKAFLATAAALMGAFLLATLLVGMVWAEPTEGQKVPVELTFTAAGSTTVESSKNNGGITHASYLRNWIVALSIDGAPPIIGEAVDAQRNVTGAYSKLGMGILHDEYVIWFATEGGGFEGNAILQITDWVSNTAPYDIMTHGVFQGTGAFEGQTLNVGVEKGPASLTWTGYLLKP
jgi:hypothetical protein